MFVQIAKTLKYIAEITGAIKLDNFKLDVSKFSKLEREDIETSLIFHLEENGVFKPKHYDLIITNKVIEIDPVLEESVKWSPKKDEKKVEKKTVKTRVAPVEKKKKDPNAPKRAISAYLYYASERRPQLKRDEPNLAFGDLTKVIAGEWKEMKEKDKKKYLKMAEDDKVRYEKEKLRYESGVKTPEHPGNTFPETTDRKINGKDKKENAIEQILVKMNHLVECYFENEDLPDASLFIKKNSQKLEKAARNMYDAYEKKSDGNLNQKRFKQLKNIDDTKYYDYIQMEIALPDVSKKYDKEENIYTVIHNHLDTFNISFEFDIHAFRNFEDAFEHTKNLIKTYNEEYECDENVREYHVAGHTIMICETILQ